MKLNPGEYVSGAALYSSTGVLLRVLTTLEALQSQVDAIKKQTDVQAERVAKGERIIALIEKQPELGDFINYIRTGAI